MAEDGGGTGEKAEDATNSNERAKGQRRFIRAVIVVPIGIAMAVWAALSVQPPETEPSAERVTEKSQQTEQRVAEKSSARGAEPTESVARKRDRELVVFGAPAADAGADAAADASSDAEGGRVRCLDRSGKPREITGFTVTTWRNSARVAGMSFDDWLRERLPRHFPLSQCQVVKEPE